MATYYKYVERDTSDYINWAEVGKNMSDMLAETNRVREEQKAFLDEKSREVGLYLSNLPQGESKSANAYALNYGGDASSFMLMQDRLLKTGQLNPKDYLIARQNLMDGTEQAFNSLKLYQQRYAELMERARTDKSAAYELDVMQRAEQFGNFSKSSLYINPTNGQVSVALKDKDGKISTNPNDVMSISSLNGLLLGRWDKFDTNKATDQFAKSLGTYTDMIRNVGGRYKAGELITMKDITNRTDIDPATKDIIFKFQQAEESGLNAILANDFNRMSVLTDYVKFSPNGKPYRFTRDKEDAKNNMEAILMEYDEETGMEKPVFTQAQMDISLKFLRDEARRKYDIERTISTYTDQIQEPRPREKTAAEIKKEQDAMRVGMWNKIFTGSNEEKKIAVQNVLNTQFAFERNLKNIDVTTPGTIVFEFEDGRSVTKNFDPETITLEQWASLGNAVHGVDDAATVVKRSGGGDPNQKLNQKDFEGVRSNVVTKEDKYNNYITTNLKSDNTISIINSTESSAVPKLQTIFGNLGFKFEESGVGSYVKIKAPDEESKEFPLNDGEAEARLTANEMIEWMQAHSTDDAIQKSTAPMSNQPTRTATTPAPAATGGASSRIANY